MAEGRLLERRAGSGRDGEEIEGVGGKVEQGDSFRGGAVEGPGINDASFTLTAIGNAVGVAMEEVIEALGFQPLAHQGMVVTVGEGEAAVGQEQFAGVLVAGQAVMSGASAEGGVVVVVVAKDKMDGDPIFREPGELI